MAGYSPTSQTVLFMAVFVTVYLAVLLRNTVRRTVDLYDFLLLSSVALVPAIAVFFPGAASRIAKVVGVEFPLVVIFGTLFLIAFVYLYRLVVQGNSHQHTITALVQETGLMRQEIESLTRQLAAAQRALASGEHQLAEMSTQRVSGRG